MLQNASSTSNVGTSHDDTSPTRCESGQFFLEISRGKTRYPRRPILKDRFLIGSASDCDLRLGGSAAPVVALILREAGELLIVTSSPDIIIHVNSQPCQSAELVAGDTIAFGSFEMVLRQRKLPVQVPGSRPGVTLADELAGKSADELASLIEQETEALAEFEDRRNTGARQLMAAIGQRMAALAAERQQAPTASQETTSQNVVDPAELELVSDMERAIERLDTYAAELEQRAARLAEREESYAEATAQLLEVQQQLSDQLDRLLSQVAEVKARQGDHTPVRRIAG